MAPYSQTNVNGRTGRVRGTTDDLRHTHRPQCSVRAAGSRAPCAKPTADHTRASQHRLDHSPCAPLPGERHMRMCSNGMRICHRLRHSTAPCTRVALRRWSLRRLDAAPAPALMPLVSRTRLSRRRLLVSRCPRRGPGIRLLSVRAPTHQVSVSCWPVLPRCRRHRRFGLKHFARPLEGSRACTTDKDLLPRL